MRLANTRHGSRNRSWLPPFRFGRRHFLKRLIPFRCTSGMLSSEKSTKWEPSSEISRTSDSKADPNSNCEWAITGCYTNSTLTKAAFICTTWAIDERSTWGTDFFATTRSGLEFLCEIPSLLKLRHRYLAALPSISAVPFPRFPWRAVASAKVAAFLRLIEQKKSRMMEHIMRL